MWVRGLYGLLTRLLLPPVLAYFYWRGRREPGYRQHWRERMGRPEGMAPGAIWIHAASVGEVALIEPLVPALAARYPGVPLLVTTMTPTGRTRAIERLRTQAAVCYVPLDTPGATRRFIKSTRPRVAIFAETELWPNLIAAITNARVPLVLVNASLSARSAARYARAPLAGLMASIMGRIDAIGAASPDHAERFRALGAPAGRIMVTGNLKYDLPRPEVDDSTGQALREHWSATARPLWVAASTHDGEEALLLEAFARIRDALPDALLLIAPRHPQRFDAVWRLLERQALPAVRRSDGTGATATTALVLADTLGEVPMFYAAADVVFVGGSLRPGVGGHNVIEAAASGRPLCVGPHVREWQDIVDALTICGAAAICADPTALASQVVGWLDDPVAARRAGAAGAACVAARRGALARTLALIDDTMA